MVGWCFGGGWALQAGLSMGSALDAVVMYYGRPIVAGAISVSDGNSSASGTRFDAAAARDAWRRTLAFLAKHLKDGP